MLKLSGLAGDTDVTGQLNITLGRLIKLKEEEYISKMDYLITKRKNEPNIIYLFIVPTAKNDIKSVTILFNLQNILDAIKK